MKKPCFTGAATALVTPFLGDEVNYPMLERLLRRQLDAGIRTVVLCGTTGEAPTLSDNEKLEIFRRAKAFTGNDCAIIAGTGTNSTAHALEMSRKARECGVDGLLVVSPYYNKGTLYGLEQHYQRIAEVGIPVIVYNVPTRTGMDMPVGLYKKLSGLSNILGVKESSADIAKVLKIRTECPDFGIWAGNDDMAVPVIALGGLGVISVLSNVCPELTAAMVNAALDGDFDTAEALQTHLQPLMEALFREVNPVPVKAAMKLLGYDCGGCRLPLTEAKPETVEVLKKILL